jgi:hypothetical protein
VVKVLKKYEYDLSDGYYYHTGYSHEQKTLRKIAIDIIKNLKKS